ncbi:MAG: hypothetical protein U5L11_03705 [Arhodomonas sp.]|nr:hypothetical protein [Arhodomonas sp.]
MKNKRIATLVGAVVAPLVLGFQAQAADVSVLGDLEVRGSAQVRAEESGAPVRLSDTSYAYVSGERIRTRDNGSAVLRLDGGDIAWPSGRRPGRGSRARQAATPWSSPKDP